MKSNWYLKIIESQYAPFGYSSQYSENQTDIPFTEKIMSKGPMSGLDIDIEYRVHPYDGRGFAEEWGLHPPNRPNGSRTEVKKILCKQCSGKGCSLCKKRGYYLRYKQNIRNLPEYDGRIKQQLRFHEKTWPHNRDFTDPTFNPPPMTFEQMMQDKDYFGKPSIF